MIQDVSTSRSGSTGSAAAAEHPTFTWTVVSDRTIVHWAASKRYLMFIPVSAKGQFSGAMGTVHVDGTDLTTAQVSLTVPAESQTSGMARRDKHLATADFFDVATHPQITFTSTAIRRLPGKDDRYAVEGNLGIKGEQKPITLEGTWQSIAGGRAKVELAGTVSRSAIGLVWSGKPLMNLLDPIELRIEAELRPASR